MSSVLCVISTRVAIITAPPDHLDEFNEALSAPELRAISRVVPGSPLSRQASVAAGLDALAEILEEEDAARKCATSASDPTASAVGEDTPVLIHDAARPLVSAQLVRRVIEALRSGEKAVIPGLPVSDTLKSFRLIDEASVGSPQSRAMSMRPLIAADWLRSKLLRDSRGR